MELVTHRHHYFPKKKKLKFNIINVICTIYIYHVYKFNEIWNYILLYI